MLSHLGRDVGSFARSAERIWWSYPWPPTCKRNTTVWVILRPWPLRICYLSPWCSTGWPYLILPHQLNFRLRGSQVGPQIVPTSGFILCTGTWRTQLSYWMRGLPLIHGMTNAIYSSHGSNWKKYTSSTQFARGGIIGSVTVLWPLSPGR